MTWSHAPNVLYLLLTLSIKIQWIPDNIHTAVIHIYLLKPMSLCLFLAHGFMNPLVLPQTTIPSADVFFLWLDVGTELCLCT